MNVPEEPTPTPEFEGSPRFELPFHLRLAGIAALLVLGLALTVGPSSEAGEKEILDERGEIATATVQRSFIVETKLGPGVGGKHVEEDVSFETYVGFPVAARLKDCDDRKPDPPGTEVEVVYDPEAPEEHVRFVDAACPETEISNALPFTIAGAMVLAIGYLWWAIRWQRQGWKWLGAAISILILGGFVTAAAFSENCDCRAMAWTSAPLAMLGATAIIGKMVQRRSAPAR
jgi:hypothetical protein